ncbi:MAG: hypothetical protein AAF411_23830, partial [Myxococcota bacterium]
MRSLLLLAALGCAAPIAERPPSASAPQASVSAAPERYRIQWGAHQVQTASCFFFSGPVLPNHEVRQPLAEILEWYAQTGEAVAGDAVFRPEGDGLVRHAIFGNGERWQVTETLRFNGGDPALG